MKKAENISETVKLAEFLTANAAMKIRVNSEEPEYIGLERKCSGERKADFQSRDGSVSASLEFEISGNCAVLRCKAVYRSGDPGERNFGAHFHPEEAIVITFGEIPETLKYAANRLRCEFWCDTVFAESPDRLPDKKIQGLLCERPEDFVYALPVCDSVFKSNLRGTGNGLELYLWSNDLRNSCESVAAVFGTGEEPYGLVPDVTEAAFRALGKPYSLRQGRRYPQILEYLGWCSWDAFHMDVTHEGIIEKAKEFRDKEIPVRWFILDDMWGDVPSINRKTMHSRELYRFEADGDRFPKGLKGVIGELRDSYGIETGIWHPTTGYWNGIDPAGEIAQNHKDLLVYSAAGKLVHSPETSKAFEYYNIQHSFYRECGATFVKVDNQGFLRTNYKNIMSIGEAAANVHKAIEASVGANFDMEMINCMCMPSECFWNRPTSSVCRFSGDFLPMDRQWFIRHILQCGYNSLFQGCVYYGDWDMWWSCDGQAVKNAVLRAMSGGPVYVSDELGSSVRKTIMPIVAEDGKILRMQNPPLPTRDCLMNDPEKSGKAFKLFGRHRDCGVLAVFNVSENEKTVWTDISSGDMLLPEGQYVCYDWFSAKIMPESFSVRLKNHDDFRLYIFVPAVNGKAVIGIMEKYMTPATLEKISDNLYKTICGGRLAVCSERKMNYLYANGIKIPVSKIGKKIYITDPVEPGTLISLPGVDKISG